MKRVLVVDDDEDIRELVTYRLDRAGYAVTSASGPQEALDLASANAFDLAVIDWSMPEMHGGELCAHLRALPTFGAAPILVVTAHADPVIHEEALASGATDYLAKPFSLQQLADVVAQLFHNGSDLQEKSSEASSGT